MTAKDDANGLDSALKKSTASARILALAIGEGTSNLHGAVRAAEMLAVAFEAVATSEKAAQAATVIGAIVTSIITAVGATVMWKDKQREITQAILETQAATRAFNATAAENPRLAQEIRISAEKQKQLHAIEEEQRALLGVGKYLHDYSAQIAAINANAAAQINALHAAIARTFDDTRFGIRTTTGRIGAAFLNPDQAALREAMAERARQLRDLENKGYRPDEKAKLTKDLEDQFNEAVRAIPQNKFRPIGEQLGLSFAQSIANGIATGIKSGNIAKGFRALAGGILSAFGAMLVSIGEKTLLASKLIATIVDSLKKLDGTGGVLASLGLIALGGVLEGLGGGMSGGFGGGGGGYGGGYGGGGAATVIDRGIINPLNGAPGSIAPRPSNTFNATFVGPRDPVVQRLFQEIVKNANGRGNV